MPGSDDAEIVHRIIRDRHTTKAYADTPVDHTTNRSVVEDLIETAGWAPFHRPAAAVHLQGDTLTSVVPWRFYVLDATCCRRVRQWLLDADNQTKVPRMLAAATALIQVTWLPTPPKEPYEGLFEPSIVNMEHIAAAAAAVQNLVLAATARGIPTYWSSGGSLREPAAFGWLGIPEQEILLGSVYLFPSDLEQVETSSGSLRQQRGHRSTWAKWVELQESTEG